MGRRRVRIEITGKVQGVGLRPAVCRYAQEIGLEGWVSNGPEGATIEAEGPTETVAAFVDRLRGRLPVLSAIRRFHVLSVPPAGDLPCPFAILPSRTESAGEAAALVPEDAAVCGDCRAEMRTPSNRRYLYPFTNCTNCGPRFTIVSALPYDRPNTTMREFRMCPECRSEYENPADRRFHAQPNACPACGPRLSWMARGSPACRGREALGAAVEALVRGEIVAIQSLGGFHLACDAARKDTVETLRLRKRRPHKPLAVMTAGLASARQAAEISAEAETLLTSTAAPVVTLSSASRFLEWLAPGLDQIGLMLAYTPLHVALFHALGRRGGPDLLVMTSGNPPGEPICRDPEEGLQRLGRIADGFLIHDRPIHNRCDDSVVALSGGTARVIRRARGFVPNPVRLAAAGPCIFSAGTDLKGSGCVTRGDEAFLTQYIGDLAGTANGSFYDEAVERLIGFLNVRPACVARDLHPDMVSSRKATALAAAWGLPESAVLTVQHHHAHIAATMAEHGLEPPVLGVAFDGVGLGTDGTLWGGEFLRIDGDRFERLGHLLPVPQPGGDRAVEEIWRMALSWLMVSLGPEEALSAARNLFPAVPSRTLDSMSRIARRPGLTFTTSSAGRLFDAVAAIAGLRASVTYEAQGAMELEDMYSDSVLGEYEFRVKHLPSGFVLDPRPAIRAAVADRQRNLGPVVISTRFHRGLAAGAARMCETLAQEWNLRSAQVVAGGGVFQNMRFLELFDRALMDAQLELYAPEKIPANDGGIALGQAWVARRRISDGR